MMAFTILLSMLAPQVSTVARAVEAGPTPRLTVDRSTVPPGRPVTVTLTNGYGGPLDSLILVPVGAPSSSFVQYSVPGDNVRNFTWTVTMPVTPGAYEFRLLPNDGWTAAATSPTMTVSTGLLAAAMEQWEENMVMYGTEVWNSLSTPDPLGATYYDGLKVFQSIAQYTHDSSWYTAADRVKQIYGDEFVLDPTNCYQDETPTVKVGCVPGYWVFTTGLTMDYLRTGDPKSKEAVLALARWGVEHPPFDGAESPARSREVAYAIRALLDAERVGAPRDPDLVTYVGYALDHLNQWFVSKTFRIPAWAVDDLHDPSVGKYYVQPFMIGITCEALIRWYDATGDARVLPAITIAADWLWQRAWRPTEEAFAYELLGPTEAGPFPDAYAAPDLNLLIAPVYAWIYKQTGNVAYRDRADRIFVGGVTGATLQDGKHFNQNYHWSYDYLRWRGYTGTQ